MDLTTKRHHESGPESVTWDTKLGRKVEDIVQDEHKFQEVTLH